jgi:Tfp pilus assembly protein PilV
MKKHDMNSLFKILISCKRRSGRYAGLTLIEILMTIFVLAVGLLGVAALMPVGSYQMQRGQIAQRVSEIGPGALDLLEASNMYSPSRWSTGSTEFDDVTEHTVSGAEQEWVRNSHTSTPAVAGEGTHVLEFIRSDDASKLGQYYVPGTETVDSGTNDVCVARRCEPFAIDPLYMYHPQAANGAATNFVSSASMPRITVSDVITSAMAESIFQNEEDLILVEDEDTGFPTGREVWGTGDNPIKAKSEGNYSWLATFSPGETDSGSDPKQWTVSVAVFYKRPLSLGTASQWTVPIQGINSSTGGYTTVTLDGSNSIHIFEGTGTFDQDAGDKMKIKRRMWGLVTFTDGIDKRARWYRVGTVQKPIDGNNNIKIRLIGPDIPDAAQSLNITFFEGLEGVFTRAMMVEELPVGQP